MLRELCENLDVNADGHLTFAGVDTVELAQKHQTPLYVMDEDRIRHNCRTYRAAMTKYFGEGSFPAFASKAASFKRLYEIMKEEGMGIDLVSPGEVYTAVKAGFPMERSFFHGNNKTDADIEYAMDVGVGHFVVDGSYELRAIQEIAARRGMQQKVLLRLTPGIDSHTFEAVSTGKVDSKFGSAIETGQAEALVEEAVSLPNVELVGYHCHIGSQIFNEDGAVYLDAARIMFGFAAEMYHKRGVKISVLNLGGGFGVRYTENDPYMDIEMNIQAIAEKLRSLSEELNMPLPSVVMEPGRSIVADAGMTLYTVGTVKEIPGYKNYVSVDGGMADNPRYALYGSAYTACLANRMDEPADFTCDLVGRCCESGDILQPAVQLPKPNRGDIAAVLTTGAYNFSMSSNYNRLAKPPVVMLKDGADYLAVRRESFEHLTANDV